MCGTFSTGPQKTMPTFWYRHFRRRRCLGWLRRCRRWGSRICRRWARSFCCARMLWGREAIRAAAAGFMTTFPDLVVAMDEIRGEGAGAVYRWTLTGTSAGKRVAISGFEEWEFGADGLIARSLGHFDEADYRRQLEFG